MTINRKVYSRGYVENNKLNIGSTSSDLVKTYDKMYSKVKDMIRKQTVYSTWIRVQFGNSQPITFNTSSTNKSENIIASLDIQQSGTNAANSFTLKLVYDPFDYGQNTTEKVQGLDDIIGQAIAYDATTDNETISGWIQYGYNYTEDSEIVSPKFKFILINAKSTIDYASGMATYTFEGTSVLALDCDFDKVTYEEISQTPFNLMDLVAWILYYYYGDPQNPPNSVEEGKPTYANSPKYKIDIPKEYFEQVEDITYPLKGNMTPWQYCLEVLNSGDNIYTKKDLESGVYENLEDSGKKPKWCLYLTDNDRTIHLVHISPLLDEGDDIDNMYMQNVITWGKQEQNLVTKWDSDIDLQLYLIQKWNQSRTLGVAIENASQDYTSAQNAYNSAMTQYNKLKEEYSDYEKFKEDVNALKKATSFAETVGKVTPMYDSKGNRTVQQSSIPELAGNISLMNGNSTNNGNTEKLNELRKRFQLAESELQKALDEVNKTRSNVAEKLEVLNNARDNYQKHIDLYEPFDATLDLVGIPAIAPVGMRIRIIPRVAENITSRQAGVYMVTECSDSITTNGTFVSTLKLYKLRDLIKGE